MDYKAALLKGLKKRSSLLNDDHNWLNLPRDLMMVILQRVGWYDVLMNVKEVCKYWYVLSKDPWLWRVIEVRRDVLTEKLRKKMSILPYKEYTAGYQYEPVCRILERASRRMVMHVVDLSCGQLHDLCFYDFGSDNLFKYIYPRTKQLRRLRLQECLVSYGFESVSRDRFITLKGMVHMLQNLPSLEELELPHTRIFGRGVEIVGRHCPHLKSFTLDQRTYDYTRKRRCDKQALAIAKTMPGLRRLRLFGNWMTITGLTAILDNCHHLQYLDLRQCYNLCRILQDKPDLETRLRRQIQHVRFPQDSTEDYEDAGSDCSDEYIGSDYSSELD